MPPLDFPPASPRAGLALMTVSAIITTLIVAFAILGLA
jgi:hypothetical protein